MPAVLNAANEVAVGRFMDGEIPFTGIFGVVRTVMERHQRTAATDLERIMAADSWAREVARALDRW